MTSICFGCEPLGGTDWGHVDVGNIKNAIHKALDLGINSFDTAGVYGLGLSEENLNILDIAYLVSLSSGFSEYHLSKGYNVSEYNFILGIILSFHNFNGITNSSVYRLNS